MYIISHTSRNSTLDYEQSIRKLNLGVNIGIRREEERVRRRREGGYIEGTGRIH